MTRALASSHEADNSSAHGELLDFPATENIEKFLEVLRDRPIAVFLDFLVETSLARRLNIVGLLFEPLGARSLWTLQRVSGRQAPLRRGFFVRVFCALYNRLWYCIGGFAGQRLGSHGSGRVSGRQAWTDD
jgi:hypothetical protein